jgi:cytochrome c-type biogenesis protein CcmH
VRKAAALLAAILALAGPAGAAAQCPKTSIADIEDEVMCPVCGTSLATSGDAPLAVQQRRLIDRLVQQCRSKEEIKDVLVAQYGESVLAEPEQEGFGLATYLVPGLAFLGGAAAVGVAWVRWRRSRAGGIASGGAAADGGPPDPAPAATAGRPASAEAARLEDDMARYDL